MARVYGLHPWDMRRLTGRELESLNAEIAQLDRDRG